MLLWLEQTVELKSVKQTKYLVHRIQDLIRPVFKCVSESLSLKRNYEKSVLLRNLESKLLLSTVGIKQETGA